MLLKLLCPLLFISGLYCLIKSIGGIMNLYAGKKVEFPANSPSKDFDIDNPGNYEISLKRPFTFKGIKTDMVFRLTNKTTENELTVVKVLNLLGTRKDLSGNRIIPVAEFAVTEKGLYHIEIVDFPNYRVKDQFIITPKTGGRAVPLIFAIIFSGIATIAGLVLSILAFLNKF
jgi:hypothetical protein